MSDQRHIVEVGKSLDDLVANALMVGYGYRKTTELRGEYIICPDHKVQINTLHTADQRTESKPMKQDVRLVIARAEGRSDE